MLCCRRKIRGLQPGHLSCKINGWSYYPSSTSYIRLYIVTVIFTNDFMNKFYLLLYYHSLSSLYVLHGLLLSRPENVSNHFQQYPPASSTEDNITYHSNILKVFFWFVHWKQKKYVQQKSTSNEVELGMELAENWLLRICVVKTNLFRRRKKKNSSPLIGWCKPLP